MPAPQAVGISCLPLYPPVELLWSLGLQPRVLWGWPRRGACRRSTDHLQGFACAVAHRITEHLLTRPAERTRRLVCTNACDTLRNLPEILVAGMVGTGDALQWFRLHLPMIPPGRSDAGAYLRDGIRAFIRSLEEACAVRFDPEAFERSVALYERVRERTRRLADAVARGGFPFARFCALVMANWLRPPPDQLRVLDHAIGRARKARSTPENGAVGIMLSGILPPAPGVAALLERAGLRVVADDIAAVSRAHAPGPAPTTDPGRYYQEMFGRHRLCPTLLHTADARLEAVVDQAAGAGARGFVLLAEKYCEYELFEWPQLARRLQAHGIHTLALECGLDDQVQPQALRTRIEAFAEQLGG